MKNIPFGVALGLITALAADPKYKGDKRAPEKASPPEGKRPWTEKRKAEEAARRKKRKAR